MERLPDHVVLRHGPDIPEEYWARHLEGRWYDISAAPVGKTNAAMADPNVGAAIAEPTGRLEVRDDGAVAEVWEIRLATPNERRRR